MKPSRLARRFNKKGRQEKKVVVVEQNPSANVLSMTCFFVDAILKIASFSFWRGSNR